MFLQGWGLLSGLDHTACESQPRLSCISCHLEPHTIYYRCWEAEALCEPLTLPSIKYEQVTVLAAVDVGTFCGAVIATDVPTRAMGFLKSMP